MPRIVVKIAFSHDFVQNLGILLSMYYLIRACGVNFFPKIDKRVYTAVCILTLQKRYQ